MKYILSDNSEPRHVSYGEQRCAHPVKCSKCFMRECVFCLVYHLEFSI